MVAEGNAGGSGSDWALCGVYLLGQSTEQP